jgi:hypothetical protein
MGNVKAVVSPLAVALARIEPMLNTASSWAIKAHLMIAEDEKPHYRAARIARETVIRSAISESCAEWIARRPLPNMDPETAVFLWERFEYAKRFGQWLRRSGADCVEKTVDDVLTWLLIDSWMQVSLAQWKQDLQIL